MPRRVVIKVPSSTTNFGPGFDTLGAALSVPNTVEAELTDGAPQVRIVGRDADRFASQMAEMARRTIDAAFAGEPLPGFKLTFHNAAPVARGLGSSAALRQGVMAAVGELIGRPLPQKRLLNLGTQLEGHPDNAVPATVGGFAACAILDKETVYSKIEVAPALKFVAAMPDFATYTNAARKVLPDELPLTDVVFNLSRCSMLVALVAQGRYDELGPFFQDRIHQPFRERLVPGLFDVIDAACDAGAIGGYLSGSGSTVMALTTRGPDAVAGAMADAFARTGSQAETLILTVDNEGLARIE